jgi:flagellar biosynthesis/type III secretory pathway protein FliH
LKKGYKKADILNLFKVIDWGLVLPSDLKIQYNHDIAQLKEEEGMGYVLSAVRDEVEKKHQAWLQEGLEQGLQEGFEKGITAITQIMRSKGLDQTTIEEIVILSKQQLERESSLI